MTRPYRLNFTYKGPGHDILDVSKRRDDGALDTTLTLRALRAKLVENVEIVDRVLEQQGAITDLGVLGTLSIIVYMDPLAATGLVRSKALVAEHGESEGEGESESEEMDSMSEPEETNHQRLTYVRNITNSSAVPRLFPESESEESTESDEIIDGGANMATLVSRFEALFGAAAMPITDLTETGSESSSEGSISEHRTYSTSDSSISSTDSSSYEDSETY